MVTRCLQDSPPAQQQSRMEDHQNAHGLDEDLNSDTTSQLPAPATNSGASSLSVPTLLSEQQKLVFGAMNKRLTDFLAARVEQTIQSTVMEGLPLLEVGPSKAKLQEALVYKFVRNVDVLEAYCEQNLLTVRNYAPATRKRIVQVLTTGEKSLQTLEHIEDNRSSSSLDIEIPRKDMLPSSSDTKLLHDGLSQLQERLKAARMVRNGLISQRKSLVRAQSMASRVVESLRKHDPVVNINGGAAVVTQQVNSAITSGNSIAQLSLEAQHVLDKLKSRRDKRLLPSQSEEHEDDDPFFVAAASSKQPRLSLEENYLRDRKQLGLLQDSTNISGTSDVGDKRSPTYHLNAIKNLLKGNVNNVNSP